ncbi:MAG: glycosyltransferase [Pseudomonadota bacterium]
MFDGSHSGAVPAKTPNGMLAMTKAVTLPSIVAITVPVGAYHPRLRDCLNSLRCQTPLVSVALMDASNDPRVCGIADEFDDLLHYRHHGPDDGQADAIAAGWAQLDGDVLGWLNADDVLLPGAIELVLRTFEQSPTADLVYGHSEIVRDNGAFSGYHWGVAPPSTGALRTNCFISQPSCFFKRVTYDRIGGLDVGLHYTMDWDLWVRFQDANAEFVFVDEVLSSVLWSKDAKTGGFGKGRRSELNTIIGGHERWTDRLKAMIGFSSHHLLEYVVPERVARAVRRVKASKSGHQYGIDWSGGLRQRASVPLYHYDDVPATKVEISYSGCPQGVRAAVDGALLPVHEHPGTRRLVLDLNEPLLPGNRRTLLLDRSSSEPLFIEGLRLLPAG